MGAPAGAKWTILCQRRPDVYVLWAQCPRSTDLSQAVLTKVGMVATVSGLMLVCCRLRSRSLRCGLW